MLLTVAETASEFNGIPFYLGLSTIKSRYKNRNLMMHVKNNTIYKLLGGLFKFQASDSKGVIPPLRCTSGKWGGDVKEKRLSK